MKINNLSVCRDGQTLEDAHIACLEQDCGNAVLIDDVSADRYPDGLLIRCESYHDQLGKCSRLQGKCKKGLMYIHCAGKSMCVYVCPFVQKQQNILETVSKQLFQYFCYFLNAESIKLKTKDHCRGSILISNRTKWEDVCIKDLPTESEGELCRQLGCDGGDDSRKYKLDRKQRSKVSRAKPKDTRSNSGRFGSNTIDNLFSMFFLM